MSHYLIKCVFLCVCIWSDRVDSPASFWGQSLLANLGSLWKKKKKRKSGAKDGGKVSVQSLYFKQHFAVYVPINHAYSTRVCVCVLVSAAVSADLIISAACSGVRSSTATLLIFTSWSPGTRRPSAGPPAHTKCPCVVTPGAVRSACIHAAAGADGSQTLACILLISFHLTLMHNCTVSRAT